MSDWSGQLGLVLVLLVIAVWLTTALAAYVLAPKDRPWHFFWCTLLLLGPFGIVLALVAPARPTSDDSTLLMLAEEIDRVAKRVDSL